MPSTRATSAFAARYFTLASLFASSLVYASPAPLPSAILNAMTYKGCFSSSTGLSDQGSYTYQTSGYCQPICVKKNQAVLGLSAGSDCWCGDELPPADTLVDDSYCSSPCDGFGSDMCGGDGYYSIYLSGTQDNVANADSDGSDSGSASSSSSSPSATTPPASASSVGGTQTVATPNVVTSVAPGRTVVITQPAAAEQTDSNATPTAQSNKGSGPNVAGIAAGVVVGVVAIGAIIAGVLLWMRHKKRQEAEQEYKKNQVSNFMASGERKAPGTAGGWSTLSDSRLDPEAGKRNSSGSIADDQDYSRRILRVANPS